MTRGGGPVIGSQCGTCNHAQRPLIEAALVGGKSVRSTALAFGLGKDALLDHWHKHMTLPGQALDRPWQPKKGQSREDALDEIITAVASGKMRPDQAAQIRIALKEKEDAGGPATLTVTVDDVPGLGELIADLADALAPFPAARKAAMEVLERHGMAKRLAGAPA